MDGVDGVELSFCVERIVELKCGLHGLWVVLLLLEEVDHLERLADVGDLFFEATTALRRVELHELVLGHGLLKLLECRLYLLIGTTEVLLHVGLQNVKPGRSTLAAGRADMRAKDRLTMKGACGIPRELVSTLDWDGPAMAGDADDMSPAVVITECGKAWW